jgi:hypothetical protein
MIEFMRETIEMYGRSLNERVKVEQELWDIARGKSPLPTAEQCAEWARRLGIPAELRERMK